MKLREFLTESIKGKEPQPLSTAYGKFDPANEDNYMYIYELAYRRNGFAVDGVLFADKSDYRNVKELASDMEKGYNHISGETHVDKIGETNVACNFDVTVRHNHEDAWIEGHGFIVSERLLSPQEIRRKISMIDEEVDDAVKDAMDSERDEREFRQDPHRYHGVSKSDFR